MASLIEKTPSGRREMSQIRQREATPRHARKARWSGERFSIRRVLHHGKEKVQFP